MIENDINARWEKGTPHHPKSMELFKSLEDIDFKLGGDFFCWKSGGDGDNGEHLMYELDIHFERLDEARQPGQAPTEPGNYWLRTDYVNRATQEVNKGPTEIVSVFLDYKPRSRKRGLDAEKVLIVYGRHWSEVMSKMTGPLFVWGKRIECDLPE